MKNKTQLLGILVVGAFALGQAKQIHAADANPPERMTYQGYLVDSAVPPVPLGNSAPTNYDIVFRVYAAKSGSQDAIWAEQQTVTVDKGYFQYIVGRRIGLPERTSWKSFKHDAWCGYFRPLHWFDRGHRQRRYRDCAEVAPGLVPLCFYRLPGHEVDRQRRQLELFQGRNLSEVGRWIHSHADIARGRECNACR